MTGTGSNSMMEAINGAGYSRQPKLQLKRLFSPFPTTNINVVAELYRYVINM